MEITSVDVYPVRTPQGKVRAFARVALDDELQLTALRVYEGRKGLFVSYPNDPSYTGEEYRQLFFPLTRDFREKLEVAVLKKYHEAIKEIVIDENPLTHLNGPYGDVAKEVLEETS